MESGSAVLWYKVGAAGGSAHGGASPPAISAGSGSIRACALFFPGRWLHCSEEPFRRFPLLRGSLPVSAFPFPSPALTGLFFGMSAGPPRVSALLFPLCFP